MKIPRTIYAIQHNETRKIYVGSSSDVENRYWSHMYALRSDKHTVEDMQEDFNEYGENYSLFILDEIHEYSEKEKEYTWIEKLQSHIREKGYNYKDRKYFNGVATKKLPLVSGIPEILPSKQEENNIE